MTRRTVVVVTLLVLIAAAVVAIGVFRVTRYFEGPAPAGEPPAAAAPSDTGAASPEGHIKARLFYGAPDGEHLIAVERDVPLGATPLEQARQIVTAQLAPAADAPASPIPAGTTLRGFFLTDEGLAVVDLSPEARTAHPGGTMNELLTVYAIVNALTVNLPAITSVQLLVNGETVESLAGHVDLRQAFRTNTEFIQQGKVD